MTHLAVIDMQHVFADPTSPWAAPRYREAATGVRRLLPAFEDGDDVTFTRFVAPEEPAGAWRAYYAQWPFALQPADAALWHLTDGFCAFAPQVLDVSAFGKWTPALAARVAPHGRLVLAGVSTDRSVLSTALAAADAGVEVLVAADACAGANDTAHAKALDVMDLYQPLIKVTTVAGVRALLGR
ncbi:cysteine hydrolase family protein [Streptomyces acidiscabies]|uniref:cysteine hydrolase family protein n=1 Tax=Streptomyces acidiscabies TaxID=42234 RepID=UPI000952214D|nr:isochorismatase family protein [Streptomyces acidiscabies]GAV38803.1 putative hydrolase [Streptomyces acidiscabies]